MAQADRFVEALGEIARGANSLPFRLLAPMAVKAAAVALGVRGCSLLLLTAGHKRLVHTASYGLSDRFRAKGLVDAKRSLQEVTEGQPVAILDASTDPRMQFPELAEQEGIASLLGVPVKVGGETVGSLRAYSRVPRIFHDREVDFLSTAADILGTALGRERWQRQRQGKSPRGTGLSPSLVRPVTFAHPSEEEFARLLDFYEIEWLYEPRSFPLEPGGRGEMFTPDFYLPALDLYLELTTQAQSLLREKKHKVRLLKALYPEVKIKLLSRRDYDRLLAKYGHGPLARAKAEGVGPVFLGRERIARRVRELGKEISQRYQGETPVLVGVLRGVYCFMADLMRHLSIPAEMDFMSISYYGEKSPAVKITKDLDLDISGRHVVLVEDIVDTGMTLRFIIAHLNRRHPKGIAVCALLDKRVRRLVDVSLDFVGFEVPDEFLVGYGLDYREKFRNLPYVAVLKPSED